jgi:hypothetical protein
MFYVKIDDSKLQKMLTESPKRASWALRESLKAAGYHLRKKMRKHIEAAEGWAPLAKGTVERKTKYNTGPGKFRTSPLIVFSRLVAMKFSQAKGKPMVKIGFFNTRSWFKRFFGVGAAAIAELHETGGSSGRFGKRPLRSLIAPVWNKDGRKMTEYIRLKFFKVFHSDKRDVFN